MPFTLDQFQDDADEPGVHWTHFITALGIYVYMQEEPPSVAAAMLAFNTTGDVVRKAVEEHHWLYANWFPDQTDPARQWIESDGQ